jgi:hypothetical protein
VALSRVFFAFLRRRLLKQTRAAVRKIEEVLEHGVVLELDLRILDERLHFLRRIRVPLFVGDHEDVLLVFAGALGRRNRVPLVKVDWL